MNPILIVQFVVGPTYKARLLYNLKEHKAAYDFFDVYILTDDVDFFKEITYPNVEFADINEARQWHKWSIDYEVVPHEKRDQTLYAKEFLGSDMRIPTLMRRFALLKSNVKDYCGFVFMDADVIPISTPETYEVIRHYFCDATEHPVYGGRIDDKITVVPGVVGYDNYHHGYLKVYAASIAHKYLGDKEVGPDFIMTDGNFRTIRFGDKSQIEPFFELINKIILDIIRGEYWVLSRGVIWNLNSEFILSIVFNLMGAVGYPMTPESGIHPVTCFRINDYPEDRFWHSGTGFIITNTKEEFVKVNYDRLKLHYESRGSFFPY